MFATKMLSFKLFFLLITVMVGAFGLYSYISIKRQNTHLLENVLISADRLSDVIKRSTRYGMLLNQRENVSEIIATIAREPGIDDIRIYNKLGMAIYYTSITDRDVLVDLKAEACVGCHGQSALLDTLTREQRVRIFRSPDGHRVVGLINPIMNDLP